MSRHSGYLDTLAHLADELDKLDVLIQRRLTAGSLLNDQVPQSQSARTVYISRDEVDWLLTSPPATAPRSPGQDEHLARAAATIAERVGAGLAAGAWLGLPALGRSFDLSAVELQAVVVCLAPELRHKYDRIYAYLQDDITRKRPSVDLVLDLVCTDESERWRSLRTFDDTAPLLRLGILHVVADPGSPSGSSGLARFLALDPRICQFLLGGAALDARLAGLARLEHPVTDPDGPPLVADLARLASRHGLPAIGPDPALVLALHGPDGVGKRELAGQVSASLGLAMLMVDARRLADPDELVRAAVREARLQDAALCVTHADERAREDTSMLPALATALRDMGGLAFVTSSEPWHGLASFGDIPVHAVPLTEPDVPRSEVLWREELAGRVVDPEPWASELAQRFCLTPGAIRAASAAADRHRLTAVEPAPLTLRDVYAACREQSATRLADLAVVIHPECGWEELVLPADRLEQLRDICTQVRHRHQVFDSWGLGARAGHGTGVTALFGGTPGTGKSMAAEVVAGDLGLDLYKVDLSGVVSKYIGETEKNLRRVFGEARSGNAVLFFDEADALFGKRTEVSDAHDRYANIETSYLLQQMELYDGVVLLATNIQQNLDEAFTRRIRFVVEFPFPDAASRARIWSTHLPATAPVAPDVDVDVLARDFPVAGGTIRNIVVNAAFLAAADGGVIDRHHILRGTRREYDKIGRLWTEP